MMKIVLLIACAVFAVNSQEPKTDFNIPPNLVTILLNALDKCLPIEEIPKMLSIIFEGKTVNGDTRKQEIHCLFIESGYGTQDGRIKIDKAADIFPDKEKMKELFTDCDKKTNSTPADNSMNIFNCFQENIPLKFHMSN